MNEPARFDRLARAYRWMEYLSFGPYLLHCRNLRLREITPARRALVYGDGDGRFLARLAQDAPQMEITAIDASRAMLRQTAARLPAAARVRLIHADALSYQPRGLFDLVVTHFFLDCFTDSELGRLVAHVNQATTPGAAWIVSDFAIPRHPALRPLGRLIIRGLYLAFAMLTGLRTRRLPQHRQVLSNSGWRLEDRHELLAGLLFSERWRRE